MSTLPGAPMIRAVFRAIAAPGRAPHDSLFAKIYYPALYGATPVENNTGAIPAARPERPYPIAIVMPGINVGPESYGWLATALAQSGFVCVLYGWIVEEMPGAVALSPGLDVQALAPATFGARPSATALSAILDDLAKQNVAGPLAGLLNLDRVLLGGHSAGGSVALLNARADWFPGLRAVFSYGAHSKASTALGYPPDALMPLPSQLPTLILGGSEDGVIAASSFRYGADSSKEPDAAGPVLRTFREALTSQRGDCHVAIVRGANHFSLSWPADPATGRAFLDWPTTRPDNEIRADFARLIGNFARLHVADDKSAAPTLLELLADRNRCPIAETR